MSQYIRSVFALALALLLLACQGNTSQRDKDDVLHLAVTIAPTASIIEAIAGDKAEVTTLLPQGNTPETYEPTPRDLASLGEARAYIYVGDLGFERSWLDRIASLYPSLSLISTAPKHEEASCSLPHATSEHSHDPHYWTSIRGIRSMARGVYDALNQLSPESDSLFRAGYESLSTEIDTLASEVDRLLQGDSVRTFVIFHPSLTDFADEFGLQQLVIEQDGKEPTPQQLATLISQAKALGVKTVFIQKEFDHKLAQSVAEELGARQVEINPLSGNWAEQIRLIARSLSHQSTP